MQGIHTILIAIHAFSNQSEQQDFCELNDGLLTFHGAHIFGPHCEGQRGQREPIAGCSVIGSAAVRSGRGDKETLWQRAASESVRQQSSHVSPHQTTCTQTWPWYAFGSSTKVYWCCTFRFFVEQMMKPHLLGTFYLMFNVSPANRTYTRYLLSAVNQELESQPVCCPLVYIQVRSGTKHLHTVGLSPVLFYSSAAPSEDSPTGKCKYTGKTHVYKCSNLLCEKKKIRHAHFFLWTNVGTSSACIPSRQGRHLRGGVCTPQVFWAQAGRKLSADQTALLKSDPHLTFLHLK